MRLLLACLGVKIEMTGCNFGKLDRFPLVPFLKLPTKQYPGKCDCFSFPLGQRGRFKSRKVEAGNGEKSEDVPKAAKGTERCIHKRPPLPGRHKTCPCYSCRVAHSKYCAGRLP